MSAGNKQEHGTKSSPRLVVVGAGSWSEIMHLPALCRLSEGGRVKYVGVCDLDLKKAESYARGLGARGFTDFETMVKETQPDGVALLAPVRVTPRLIEHCINLRLPFITEKPPAPDAVTHRQLLEKAGDIPHVVAYNRRHAPYMQQAREWMREVPIQGVFGDFSRYNRKDPDFGATYVHGIDVLQFLAGEDFAEVHLEASPVNDAWNFYISGWTVSGIRLELRITPTTGSAREHYTLVSSERSVVVAYPQPPMIDLPGYVELHDRNKVMERKSAVDFGLAPDDLPGLGGIVREHELFIEMLEGHSKPCSTLVTSLSTQLIREAITDLVRAGGRGRKDLVVK